MDSQSTSNPKDTISILDILVMLGFLRYPGVIGPLLKMVERFEKLGLDFNLDWMPNEYLTRRLDFCITLITKSRQLVFRRAGDGSDAIIECIKLVNEHLDACDRSNASSKLMQRCAKNEDVYCGRSCNMWGITNMNKVTVTPKDGSKTAIFYYIGDNPSLEQIQFVHDYLDNDTSELLVDGLPLLPHFYLEANSKVELPILHQLHAMNKYCKKNEMYLQWYRMDASSTSKFKFLFVILLIMKEETRSFITEDDTIETCMASVKAFLDKIVPVPFTYEDSSVDDSPEASSSADDSSLEHHGCESRTATAEELFAKYRAIRSTADEKIRKSLMHIPRRRASVEWYDDFRAEYCFKIMLTTPAGLKMFEAKGDYAIEKCILDVQTFLMDDSMWNDDSA